MNSLYVLDILECVRAYSIKGKESLNPSQKARQIDGCAESLTQTKVQSARKMHISENQSKIIDQNGGK